MPRAFIVFGLAYGDEGKGGIVDAITKKHAVDLIVRFNGGAQAAHNVVLDSGMHHCFAQFGSGTFHGARTLLSRFMLLNPLALFNEADALQTKGIRSPLKLIHADSRALVTTPFHVALNRLCELARGKERHGSCGMGIGETVQDSLDRPDDCLRVGDLLSVHVTRNKMMKARKRCITRFTGLPDLLMDHSSEIMQIFQPSDRMAFQFCDIAAEIEILPPPEAIQLLQESRITIFEGAQGVMLDEEFGTPPFVTWSKTTPLNAREILAEAGIDDYKTIGVTRTYTTRHGPGPFPTEDKYAPDHDGEHNSFGAWQGEFRTGSIDFDGLRYAIEKSGKVDSLALTHLDKVENKSDFVRTVEKELGLRVDIQSFGPRTGDKIFTLCLEN